MVRNSIIKQILYQLGINLILVNFQIVIKIQFHTYKKNITLFHHTVKKYYAKCNYFPTINRTKYLSAKKRKTKIEPYSDSRSYMPSYINFKAILNATTP